MEEEWRDIAGWEGIYQVSNLGRVRRLVTKSGRLLDTPKILKPQLGGKYYKTGCGYLHVQLGFNGRKKFCNVHRLIATAFVPNPNNFPEVNHKDENPMNNISDNLEWCDRKYNVNYGTCKERANRSKRLSSPKNKKVNQYDLDGNFIRQFISTRDAERQMNCGHGSIACVCRGRGKTCLGYIWRFA